MSNLEYCCICEQPTGRAGKGNDSLYGDDDSGPYCEACWDEREKKEKIRRSKMTYDDVIRSTVDHVARVGELLAICAHHLVLRGVFHDRSKFSEKEWPYFAEHTPELSALTYGSDEYKAELAAMRPAVKHHQSLNRHHPEFFADGIRGMTLLDLLEMLCDWKAASERHADGDISRSIALNVDRFEISDELAQVLRNTITDLNT